MDWRGLSSMPYTRQSWSSFHPPPILPNYYRSAYLALLHSGWRTVFRRWWSGSVLRQHQGRRPDLRDDTPLSRSGVDAVGAGFFDTDREQLVPVPIEDLGDPIGCVDDDRTERALPPSVLPSVIRCCVEMVPRRTVKNAV
mgnify:CR=1 FL=1